MIGNKEIFDGRSRRPPKDPANALLGLGYILLGGEISGMLSSYGLDPCLGFLHQARRGLPALAPDILEEFRAPVIDRLVLALLNKHELEADDFCAGPKGGMRLKVQPLKRFLLSYENSLLESIKQRNGEITTFRCAIGGQCARMRQCIEKRMDYEPYKWQRG